MPLEGTHRSGSAAAAPAPGAPRPASARRARSRSAGRWAAGRSGPRGWRSASAHRRPRPWASTPTMPAASAACPRRGRSPRRRWPPGRTPRAPRTPAGTCGRAVPRTGRNAAARAWARARAPAPRARARARRRGRCRGRGARRRRREASHLRPCALVQDVYLRHLETGALQQVDHLSPWISRRSTSTSAICSTCSLLCSMRLYAVT